MDGFLYPYFNDSSYRDCRASAEVQFIRFVRRVVSFSKMVTKTRIAIYPLRALTKTFPARLEPQLYPTRWPDNTAVIHYQTVAKEIIETKFTRRALGNAYPTTISGMSLDTPRRIPMTNYLIINTTWLFSVLRPDTESGSCQTYKKSCRLFATYPARLQA